MENCKSKIIQAAENSGFNLEFRAKKILDEEEYTCSLGSYYKLDNNYIEVDIVAAQHMGHVMVGECKGSNPDSHLILIKESSNKKNFNDRGLKIGDSKNRLVQFSYEARSDSFKTITGDFYNNNFKKTSKSDDRNNFYKAQSQIANGINAVSYDIASDEEKINYITPFILTNADIWVVDFNQQESEAKRYKWVLHESHSSLALSLYRACGEVAHKYCLPIININYFSEFISCHKRINLETRSILLNSGLIG